MSTDARRVLVLGVGGVVGQGIIEALRLAKTRHWIEAACVSAEAPGLLMADGAQLSPYAADDGFLDWLDQVCEELSIDIVLSGQEDVLEALAARAEDPLDGDTGVALGVDTLDRLRLTRDKLRMSEWLDRERFPTPKTVPCSDRDQVESFLATHPAPWVLKPRRGHGALGVLTTGDPDRVRSHLGEEEMLAQAFVETDAHEHTIACLFDLNSTLVGSAGFERTLRDGTTVWARPLPEDAPSLRLAEEICARLGVTGPCNLQFKIGADGLPHLLDINLRFSSTAGMRAQAGFNDVAAAVDHWLADPSPQRLHYPQDSVAVRHLTTRWVPETVHAELERGGRIELARERSGVDRSEA